MASHRGSMERRAVANYKGTRVSMASSQIPNFLYPTGQVATTQRNRGLVAYPVSSASAGGSLGGSQKSQKSQKSHKSNRSARSKLLSAIGPQTSLAQKSPPSTAETEQVAGPASGGTTPISTPRSRTWIQSEGGVWDDKEPEDSQTAVKYNRVQGAGIGRCSPSMAEVLTALRKRR